MAAPAWAQQPAGPAPGGARVAGRVVDRGTGRPIAQVRITVVGQGLTYSTDLDGRYRTAELPEGIYTLRARSIGYQISQVDTVQVVEGRTAIVDFALSAVAAVELTGITVEAEVANTPATDAGLLAAQQAAPAVSDGISAETISRAPDSKASDAISRVTGASVVDGKFVVLRGLPERYSNTLLNGSELPSPEPLRRIVPLDVFPASLLESIVTAKTATPDRPGDFAGGSVEIRTKEFPEEFVAQASVSAGYNSVATFQQVPLVPRSGWALLGFGGSTRRPPSPPLQENETSEASGEAIRNVWAPSPRSAPPKLGATFNLGGQTGGRIPVGFVLALNYSLDAEYVPERLFAIYEELPSDSALPTRSLVYQEGTTAVDWGAIANFSTRLGTGTKLGWKNIYTRNSSELALTNAGFDTENSAVIRSYQVRYTEQDLLQTQLSGEHLLGWFLNSRLEWRGTWARARRDETDNRQVRYVLAQTGEFSQAQPYPTRDWVRLLDDVISAGQGDWSFPFSLRQPQDAQLKFGGLARRKNRDFDAQLYSFVIDNAAPGAEEIVKLPPEEAFAPENVGTVFRFERTGVLAQPYAADDDVTAGYGMLDFPLLRSLRLVGGVRYEDWRLNVYPGGRDSTELDGDITRRVNRDWLWSGNVTWRLSGRTNVRLAAYRTVTRPDAREVSPDAYVAVTGDCDFGGNPEVQRTTVLNGDFRFEVFPAPGELFAISGFYKRFDRPIIEFLQQSGGGQCRIFFGNGLNATNYGAEFEFRKGFGRFFSGVNFTLVRSRIAIDPQLGAYDPDLALQGQSPVLVNGNLGYFDPDSRIEITALANYFSDRIVRYGRPFAEVQGPNTTERGRLTLDAKAKVGIGRRLGFTLAGRNLTNEVVEFVNQGPTGTATVGRYRPGVDVSFGVSYDF
jgi:hypothetical protein